MDFRIGDVVNRTFGAISRNFLVFFLLSAVLVGIPTVALGLIQYSVGVGGESVFWLTFALAFFVNIAAAYVLQGALIHGAVVDFNGSRASFGNCLKTGVDHLFPLFVIAILMTLGVSLGMMLLIVPGIILSIMWIVAVPAQVVENKGITESFGRSRELTKGNRWKIFGLFIIYLILATVISMLVMLPATVLTTSSGAETSLMLVFIQVVSTVLTAVVSATGVSALYYELRKSKEGVGAEALAKVFD